MNSETDQYRKFSNKGTGRGNKGIGGTLLDMAKDVDLWSRDPRESRVNTIGHFYWEGTFVEEFRVSI